VRGYNERWVIYDAEGNGKYYPLIRVDILKKTSKTLIQDKR